MIPKTHEAVLMGGNKLSMLWLFVQVGYEAWEVQKAEVLDHPGCVRHTRLRGVGDIWSRNPSSEFIIRTLPSCVPSCEEKWAVSVDYAEKEGRIVIAASHEKSLERIVEVVRRFVDNPRDARRTIFYPNLQIEIRPVAA
jgi:hypothetical protein